MCASEAISIGSRFDVNDVDERSKSTATVVDHCYSCAPITLGEATQVPVPASAPIGLSFSVHTISNLGHSPTRSAALQTSDLIIAPARGGLPPQSFSIQVCRPCFVA